MAPSGMLCSRFEANEHMDGGPEPAPGCDRAEPWEGDRTTGSKSSHIATLAERLSCCVMLGQVDSKDRTNVIDALTHKVKLLKAARSGGTGATG